MSATLTAAELRALDVAYRDFVGRVSWADSFDVDVSPDGDDAYAVAFVRAAAPGAPSRRGGGIDAGVMYRVTTAGAIERVTYPR